MIFTLNGGPGDGQRVEVGGKHDDGRTVRFALLHQGKQYVYVCPSEDDFFMRQLFLTRLEEKDYTPVGSEAVGKKTTYNHGSTAQTDWNDWKESKKSQKRVLYKDFQFEPHQKYMHAKNWHINGHESN